MSEILKYEIKYALAETKWHEQQAFAGVAYPAYYWEAAGGKLEQSGLILMHAEDQLMSAETFRVFAEELIEVYKRMTT